MTSSASYVHDSWNTKIAAHTMKGNELSPSIRFKRGLSQEDALFSRLFTLCINLVAWKLSSAEGYRLSKPIASRVTNNAHVDDLEVFAASEAEHGAEDGENSNGKRGTSVEPKKVLCFAGTTRSRV